MVKQNSLSIACFLLLTLGWWGKGDRSSAQISLPSCEPPQAGELLVLVSTPTPDARELLRRGLPDSTKVDICQYRGNVSSRVGGFENVSIANKWGRYINEILGLQISIARLPNDTSVIPTTPSPSPSPSPLPPTPPPLPPTPPPLPPTPSPLPPTPSSPPPIASTPPTSSYNPSPLGEGYAVIVDYFSNPEIAVQLQQLLGENIGLVSYFSRPYLLIGQTQDQQQATLLLQQLSDRGFSVLMINSRQGILLTPQVANPSR